MSPPIRDGSGNDIGAIRLGDGSEISEVRTGAGDVLFKAIPDSVVSQYDATEEDSTGDITTISDLVGSFKLSGNASVISDGINGLQTFRFDGTESMSHTDTVATSDPFAIIMVIQQQETLSKNFILDGGSQDELRVQDSGGGTYDLARSNFIGGGGTPDTNPHILLVEGFGGSDARVEVDGTEVVNGTGATTDLTGLIFPASPSRSEKLQADIGQVEITQGHSDSDLQSIKERLQNKWGTPSLS